MRHGPRIKYGVKVPANYEQAMKFDRDMGNDLWKQATKLELDQLYEYVTTRSLGKGAKLPHGYTQIRCHLVYDVKQDGRRKARMVAGGHLTGPNTDTYYSSVMSLRTMRIGMFLAELNSLDLWAGDIGNAYLEAYTSEKVAFIAGKELANYGEEGHLLVIVKALYGLKTSGARYHKKFSETMVSLGFLPSKADSDVWIKDCGNHYEYVCTWVDDLLYAGRDSQGFFHTLEGLGYKLKGVGPPHYHPSGDFKRIVDANGEPPMLTWGATTYVKWMLESYVQLFGEPVPKRTVTVPLPENDHPELDDSLLLDENGVKKYWQMIGEMQWAVAFVHIDLISATVTMA
jgi:hypothetical protein